MAALTPDPTGVRFLAFLRAHERSVWAVLALCTLVLGTAALRVPLRTDFESLHPPGHPFVALQREHRDMLGTPNRLEIVLRVRSGTIYTVETLRKIDAITRALLVTPGVDPTQVASLTHPRVRRPRVTVAGIEVEPIVPVVPSDEAGALGVREAVRASEGVRGVYVSSDERAAKIRAGVWERGADPRRLFDRIERLRRSVEDERHEWLVSGTPMLHAFAAEARDALVLAIAAGLVTVGVFLAAYFGTAAGVVIPIVSGLLSAIWAVGFSGLAGFTIDPLAVVVFVLLTARALSHSVQSIGRYHEELEARGEPEAAIAASLGSIFRPATVAIASDGLAVLTLAITTIPLVQRIAWISSFWILSMTMTVVVLHPLLLLRFGRILPGRPPRERFVGRALGRVVELFATVALRRPRAVLAGAGLTWVVALGIASRLTVGGASMGESLFRDDHPYNQADRAANRGFAGTADLVVVAEEKEPGALRTAAALAELEAFARALGEAESVGGTMTVASRIRRLYRTYHEGEPRWEILPRDPDHLGQMLFALQAASGRGELDSLVSPDLRRATVTAMHRGYGREAVDESLSRAERFVDAHADGPLRYHLAGGAIALAAATREEIVWSRRASLVSILLVVFALSAAAYRSAVGAATVMVPSLLAQALGEAVMVLAGIEADVHSLPVVAVGIGIGIDYAYYVYSRILEESRALGSVERGVGRALATTGRATLATGATLLASIAFWVWFPMKFQAEMAMLLAFVLVAHVVGALVLIPAVVSVRRLRSR